MSSSHSKIEVISVKFAHRNPGNGWFDPWAQYPAYLPFAYQANVLKKDSQAAKKVEEAHDACKKVMDRIGKPNLPVHEDTCEDILNVILDSTIETSVRLPDLVFTCSSSFAASTGKSCVSTPTMFGKHEVSMGYCNSRLNGYLHRLTDKYPACGMNWPPDLSMLYDYLPVGCFAFHEGDAEFRDIA